MTKTVIILSVLALLAGGCRHKKPATADKSETDLSIKTEDAISLSPSVNLSAISMQTDTIINDERYMLFGRDSACCILSDGSGRKVVYITAIPDGVIHYKIYDAIGNLREIAYARHVPLVFDSTAYYGDIMHPHPDSVVQYYDNGVIRKTGYVEYKAENYQYASFSYWIIENNYDSTGTLIYKITYTEPDIHIVEEYYRNGKIKLKSIQGYVGAGGASLGITEWDSLGHKTREYGFDYKYPEWGESEHDWLQIIKITEYYANGKVKQISRTKNFAECDPICPCGKWLYYNEKGQIIRTEQHKTCDNFLVECEIE